jgi:hypothetical protein
MSSKKDFRKEYRSGDVQTVQHTFKPIQKLFLVRKSFLDTVYFTNKPLQSLLSDMVSGEVLYNICMMPTFFQRRSTLLERSFLLLMLPTLVTMRKDHRSVLYSFEMLTTMKMSGGDSALLKQQTYTEKDESTLSLSDISSAE